MRRVCSAVQCSARAGSRARWQHGPMKPREEPPQIAMASSSSANTACSAAATCVPARCKISCHDIDASQKAYDTVMSGTSFEDAQQKLDNFRKESLAAADEVRKYTKLNAELEEQLMELEMSSAR